MPPSEPSPESSPAEALLEAHERLRRLVRESAGAPAVLAAVDQLALRHDQVLKDNGRLTQRTIELTLAVDSVGLGTWIWSLGGRDPELESERGIAPLLGLADDRWDGRLASFLARVAAEDRERVGQALRAGLPADLEFQVVWPDGQRRWLAARGQPLHAETGETVLIAGTLEDVTEREAMQEGLRDAEAKYRSLVEQIPAIVYIVKLDRDGNGRTTYISRQVETVLGYTAAEWLADPHLWWKIIHPRYQAAIKAEIDRKDQQPESRQRIRQEYPVYAKDGRLVWLLNESHTAWGRNGRVRYTDGVLLDVTERRREDERRLALEAAFDALGVGVTVSSLEGMITYVNPALLRMHGYAAASELVGRPSSVLGVEGPPARKPGEGTSHETLNRRSDGTTFRVRLSSRVVAGSDGDPFAIVTVCEPLSPHRLRT